MEIEAEKLKYWNDDNIESESSRSQPYIVEQWEKPTEENMENWTS